MLHLDRLDRRRRLDAARILDELDALEIRPAATSSSWSASSASPGTSFTFANAGSTTAVLTFVSTPVTAGCPADMTIAFHAAA
jgi:hypothetical protein